MDEQKSPVENLPVDSENHTDEQTISYDKYRKLLDEKKKTQAQLTDLLKNEKKRQEDLLIQEGKLKEALELREKELNEEREKRLQYETRDKEAKKLRAIIKGLGTNDIEDKWFNVIGQHIEDVKIDETGEIDTKTVLHVVDSLKKTWPEMIKKTPPGMPNGHPAGGPTTISREEWLKLSSKEMLKWKPDQIINK